MTKCFLNASLSIICLKCPDSLDYQMIRVNCEYGWVRIIAKGLQHDVSSVEVEYKDFLSCRDEQDGMRGKSTIIMTSIHMY